MKNEIISILVEYGEQQLVSNMEETDQIVIGDMFSSSLDLVRFLIEVEEKYAVSLDEIFLQDKNDITLSDLIKMVCSQIEEKFDGE